MKKHYGQIVRSLMRLSMLGGIFLAAAGIVSLLHESYTAGIVEIILGIGFFAYVCMISHNREQDITEYINFIKQDESAISGNIMQEFPLPIVVLHIDGNILWYNDEMVTLAGREDLFGIRIDEVVPAVNWGAILKSSGKVEQSIEWENKHYLIKGEIIENSHAAAQNGEHEYSVYLFFIDKTREEQLAILYNDNRTDVAVISIDNYDYMVQKTNDSDTQDIVYQINRYINEWVEESNGILKKTDRDRYFAFFEHKYLNRYITTKFSVVERVRALAEQIHIPVSVSIGIGTGSNIADNESDARVALEITQGRGGDQVAVKYENQYKFYCTKTREYEKSTQVKTRAVSMAVKEFINGVDKVIFMGHKNLDYDCFGAAMGLQAAVRAMGKKPFIICDNTTSIEKLYKKIIACPEYQGLFINEEEAVEISDRKNTLLIILDTHRPIMLPCKRLLELLDKVVLIDHHRRATDFINPCSLVYHEPSASSTCEMVTEMLQYLCKNEDIREVEAEALYMGILMDTKNFLLKTGVRTFEAASFLKRIGLNTVAVRRVFSVNKKEYDRKTAIVTTAEFVTDEIAVAMCHERYDNIRVVASQAADDMLTLENVKASFVIYEFENGWVGISGRSLGDINVQAILEKLGGGGHLTVAGVQIKNKSMMKVKEELKQAVLEYIEENK